MEHIAVYCRSSMWHDLEWSQTTTDTGYAPVEKRNLRDCIRLWK